MRTPKRAQLHLIGWGMVTPNEMGEEIPQNDPCFGDGYDHRLYWDGDRFLGPDPWGVTPIYEDRYGRRFPSNAELVSHCILCGTTCVAVPHKKKGGRVYYRHLPMW